MWIEYKKRKRLCDIISPSIIKKYKTYIFNKKRKYHKDPEYLYSKKQKQEHKSICIFHEETYICDIYECSGVQKYYKCNHIPYII